MTQRELTIKKAVGRVLFFLCLMPISITTTAQPNYKFILQHMDEMSDHEAIFRLTDYQAWYPKKPHAYYLMGNIYYRLFQQEHSIADYQDKQRMIYNATLYYGNCRVFLKNDHIKADMYPLASKNGKVSEEIVTAWLNARIDSLQTQKHDIEALYDAYTTLVSRYDTCQALFSGFATRYQRMKNAQLRLDSIDDVALSNLREKAKLLPADIERFQEALKKSPIAGYTPSFNMRPITLYRLDGLTATDFLRNDVTMWDYLSWLDSFTAQQQAITQLRNELFAEQNRLTDTKSEARQENKHLLNKINKYDEQSPLIALLHLEYLTISSEQLYAQLTNELQKEETDWLIRLQLAYRLRNINSEALSSAYRALEGEQPMTHLKLHFNGFTETYFHGMNNLAPYLLSLQQRRETAWDKSVELLTEAVSNPVSLQIDNNTEALLTKESLTFTQISTEK